MLSSLHIKNYALIDEVFIDFSPGLNVITGETGSGKSVVMQALQLVLGARAEGVSFFDPDKKCIIELNVKIDSTYRHWFEANDLDYDQDCLIRRELSKQAKSRLFINDTPIKQSVLNNLTDELLSFHSQHESYGFLKPTEQFQLLDEYAGNTALLTEYKQLHSAYKRTTDEWEKLSSKSDEFEREWAYQLHLKKELDELNLDQIDQEALEQQYNMYSQSEKIVSLIGELNQKFELEPYGLIDQLRSIQRLLSELQRISPIFSNLFERIQAIIVESQDISDELQRALDAVAIDANEYEEISLRLSELHRLQKKHGVNNCEGLIDKRDALSKNLGTDQQFQDRINTLEKQLVELKNQLLPLAKELSSNRKKAAKELSAAIEEVLASLEMPSAQLKIDVAHRDAFVTNGSDEVLFKFQANKGSELLDLKQVISGGELSRLALAIQYIKGKSKAIPTQVFDEIDTGVSGQVAERVAQLFELMGKRHQLLVITHLPQVAAKGSHHLKIAKTEASGRAFTQVMNLSSDDREREIASMIEGKNPSQTAISHARTLLTKR